MKFVYKDVEINYIYLKSKKKTKGTKTILFLHGWGGSVDSFKFFAECEQDRTNCILLDFPPFGGSSDLVNPWTVKDYACMVESLMDFLGIKSLNIVAHSFGGRVAIELSASGHLNIEKLLLTGCAGIKKKSFTKTIKILNYKFLKFLSKIKLYKKEKLTSKGSRDFVLLSPCMRKTFINIVNYDQTSKLKNINSQVLLVWGRFDKDTPFCFTKIFKKNIKDCEVVSLNGGHFAYLEFPSLFLKIMKEFFS